MKTTEKNRVAELDKNGITKTDKHEAHTEIRQLQIEVAEVTIEGTANLIIHAWSEKAMQMMEDKQRGKANPTRKEAKKPVECFLGTIHRLPDGRPGFPACAIKKAMVSVANHMDLKKTDCRLAFHVIGDLIPIIAPPLRAPITDCDIEFKKEIESEHKLGISMRKDMVRVGMGTADIRYRAQFPTWRMTFKVRFNKGVISLEQVVNVIELAGFANGLGEGRPQKGDLGFGTFQILK